MTWDPDTYPTTIRADIHHYDELQKQVVRATDGIVASSILDLGVGAGETAGRLLQVHRGSRLVGIDSSPQMLSAAARNLPEERVTLVQQDLAAPLPKQRFDLIVSALAVHHLEGDHKAKLFIEIARRLCPGGVFVLGDVVVPEDPADVMIENEPGYDFPSTIGEQLRWLADAGLSGRLTWVCRDLAVLKAELTQKT